MRLHAIGRSGGLPHPVIGRITTSLLASEASRRDSVLFWKAMAPPVDTFGYLAVLTPHKNPAWQTGVPLVHSLSHLEYLTDGDVVHVGRDGLFDCLSVRAGVIDFDFDGRRGDLRILGDRQRANTDPAGNHDDE